jgi:sarcosine/dimethylglycine N-methyltransferase
MHFGVFEAPGEPLARAQLRAKRRMAEAASLAPGKRVIEVACGFGSTARYLAHHHGVSVMATNIAEVQLEIGRAITAAEGLTDKVEFAFGDYHELGFAEASFDCWWCQEALLYAVDRRRVMIEAARVVRPGGRIVFSDLLLARTMDPAERARLTAELKATDIWWFSDWDRLLAEMQLEVVERHDWSAHTPATFERIEEALLAVAEEFAQRIGAEAVEGTKHRIRMQLEAARAGALGWGFYAIQR